jgi:hypothetical protein
VSSDAVAGGPLEITLGSGSELESQARDQLLRLLAQFDLDPWRFTDKVRIETGAFPHSHPVLTLNTRYVGRDHLALSTYVHEQIHWWVASRDQQREAAIAEARERWPEVPVLPEGARSAYSTYLHLAVCSLEYRALAELLGEATARDILANVPYYTWIYRVILDEPEWFDRWLARHDLIPDTTGGGPA